MRGIPDIAPVLDKIRDYDETDIAVLNKVKMDAQQQFKRFSKSAVPQGRSRGGYQMTDSNSKNPQRVEKQDYLTIHNLRQGEDLAAFESKTPNNQYVPYLKHELQAISAAMGLPYEFLMLIFTEGSFSSNRAALVHARQTFLSMHRWVIDTFMNRLYNWRIAKAIKDGDLPPAPVDDRGVSQWFRKDWSLPYFGWVDPDKEASGNIRNVSAGFMSIKSVIKERGGDRDDVFAEKAQDIIAAKLAAKKINEAVPDDDSPANWRDIVNQSTSFKTGQDDEKAKVVTG